MLILAPMAGATDQAFRLVAKSFGCDWLVSEMVSAKGLIYGNRRTAELMSFSEQERPFSVQIFGSEPQCMAEAARIVEGEVQPDFIDINMGCPTPKIVKNGDGAALLRSPAKAARVAQSVVEAVSIPVSAKIRLGWSSDTINAVEVGRYLESAGIEWLAVHGRTREQYYAGKADWGAIADVVRAVAIPVAINGDIDSPEAAAKARAATGAEDLMIGRAALGNPWLFQDIKHYRETGAKRRPPTAHERVEVVKDHLQKAVCLKGERRAVLEMRSHAAWYFKGVPDSAPLRRRFNACSSCEDYVRVLTNWLEQQACCDEVDLIQ